MSDDQMIPETITDETRTAVEDRIRDAVDHCVRVWDVPAGIVLEILQDMARDEAEYQREIRANG